MRRGGLTMAEKEYIEREAIINKIVNTPTVPTRQCYEGNFVYADGVSGRQNEIINYINEQPAVDVAPVRHGHWVETIHKGYKCSLCNCLSSLFDENLKSEYCPWCGAKMDGGVQNGRQGE